MTAPPYSAILFDLDGTIVDSAGGIVASLAYTFRALDLPVPTDEQLLHWVGPPIMDSFRDLAGFGPEMSARALAVYREHYVEFGLLDADPYPGVPDVLRDIHAAGLPLSLATSKPESSARRILDHLHLTPLFTEVTGASEDEVRSAKADVVAEALRRLALRGVDLSRPVMVGDRKHDVHGAAAHGVPTIFVAWGYGDESETQDTVAAVATADELRAALGLRDG